MKKRNNLSFRPTAESDTRWCSDRPSGASSEKTNPTIELPENCRGQRNMERYLTWLAWKGKDVTVEKVRVRSWKNMMNSFASTMNGGGPNQQKNMLFMSLIPLLPFKKWMREWSRIWNGVSAETANEIPAHIYVPGYRWTTEITEMNGLQSIRFIGKKQ